MKSIQFLVLAVLLLPIASCSQVDIGKLGKDLNKAVNSQKPLSNDEIISGLKEALTVGSNNAASSGSKQDGFFKHPKIKIPFPPETKGMESQLRSLGMGKQVDDFILTMNRAAEEASKEAAPVFVNAVKSMSISDGVSILKGSDTAATSYLKQKTSPELHSKFVPIIHSATQKVEVTKYWNPLVTAYNKIPFVTKQNPDIDEYINQKALSGLFYLVSQEEIKIRKDPAARVTDLLKKVFGSK